MRFKFLRVLKVYLPVQIYVYTIHIYNCFCILSDIKDLYLVWQEVLLFMYQASDCPTTVMMMLFMFWKLVSVYFLCLKRRKYICNYVSNSNRQDRSSTTVIACPVACCMLMYVDSSCDDQHSNWNSSWEQDLKMSGLVFMPLTWETLGPLDKEACHAWLTSVGKFVAPFWRQPQDFIFDIS